MMKKNILIVTIQFFPDFGGAVIRTRNIALMLKISGNDVVVLTVTPSYLRNITRNIRANANAFIETEEYEGIKILRMKMIPLQHIGLLERLARYIYFLIISVFLCITIRKLLYSRLGFYRIDYVYAHFPPIFSFLIGYIYAKLLNAKLLIDVHDLLPEQLKSIYSGPFHEIIEHFLYAIAFKLYYVSYKITLSNSTMKPILKKHYNIESYKMLFVPTGIIRTMNYDKYEARKLLINKGLLPYQYSEKILIAYTGVIDPPQGLDLIVKAFAELRKKRVNNMALLIVGDGKMRGYLESLVRELNLDNVYIHCYVPKSLADLYVCAADIGLIPLKLPTGLKIGLPTKFFDYIACGKPILNVSESMELHALTTKYGVGLSAQPKMDSIIKILLEISQKPSLIEINRKDLQNLQKELALESIAKQLYSFLTS